MLWKCGSLEVWFIALPLSISCLKGTGKEDRAKCRAGPHPSGPCLRGDRLGKGPHQESKAPAGGIVTSLQPYFTVYLYNTL